MDHHRLLHTEEKRRRWRLREKAHRHLLSIDRTRLPGNGQFGEWVNVSSKALDNTSTNDTQIEECSYASEFSWSSSNISSGISTNALMVDEISREKEIRCPPPSIIARLMGLDTLPPPQVVHEQQRMIGWHSQKISSAGVQEKHAVHDDGSIGKTTNENKKFKDVFEVMESCTVDRNNIGPKTDGLQCPKGVGANISFINQRFTDAKGSPTDEMVDDSEELKDVLGVLDSDGDPFLKPPKKANSLFAKHFQDLKYRDVAMLKSSKATKFKCSNLIRRPAENAERCSFVQKDITNSLPKPGTSLSTQRLMAQSGSVSCMLLESEYADKRDTCAHPTQVVLLKPSLDKLFHSGDRNYGELQNSRIMGFYGEGRDKLKFSYMRNTEHKAKRSTTSRNIIKEKINNVTNDIDKVRVPRFNKFITGESRNEMSRLNYLKSYKTIQRNSNGLGDQYKHYKPSSSYSAEKSGNKEVRRHLFQQWKMAHRFGRTRLADKDSNTLAEMLALSDKDISKTLPDFSIIQNVSNGNFSGHEFHARFPVISDRDGWKDGCTSSISSTSSIAYNSKMRRRHQIDANGNYIVVQDVPNLGANVPLNYFYPTERLSYRSSRVSGNFPHSSKSSQSENKLSAWDSCIHPKSRKMDYLSNLFGEKLVGLNEVIVHKEKPPANIGTGEDVVGQLKQIVVLSKKGQIGGVRDSAVIEEPYAGHSPVGTIHPRCDRREPGSPDRLEELEHPSPVSVLEPLSEGDKCSSGCFDTFNRDLNELCQLLKLEPQDNDAESEVLTPINEDIGGECHSYSKFRGILQELKSEEEREFSYLLDVLIYSGVCGTNQNRIFDACYSPEHPVYPEIFEKLEKNYGDLSGWSSSERKLFFDLVNIALAQFLAPCLDFHPWVKSKRKLGQMFARERLVEEIWQTVVKLRKELSIGNPEDKVLDTMWLDLGDDVDIIGRKIEGMLKEELLEELVSDFLLG